MKLLLITLTTIASFFVTNANASGSNPTTVTTTVLHSFQKSFKEASNITWTVTDDFYKAHFVLNNQQVVAYFESDGRLVAVTRNIISQQLPIVLQASLKKDYKDLWISELFELANEEGTTYYITLEDADQKITLKSTSNADWTTFKKTRK